MRGFCWALRNGTAGLEVEQLDDKDAYREAWDNREVWDSAAAAAAAAKSLQRV